MQSAARAVTLAVIALIAVTVLFAAYDRGRAGLPSATLDSLSAASNKDFIVTAVTAGSMVRRGDRIRIDDPAVVAAYRLHALAAGSVLRAVRTAPLPQLPVTIPVEPARRPNLTYRIFVAPIAALFLAVAALIAWRGRVRGALALAWTFALLTVLVNPTTPAWPGWLVLTYSIGSGLLSALAMLCATEFATRMAAGDGARWTLRIRRISGSVAAGAAAVSLAVGLDSVLAAETPVTVQNAPLVCFFAQALVFMTALSLAYIKAPAGDRQRVLWVAASLATGIAGFVAAVGLELASVSEPLRDYPLFLLLAMPLGCAYAILRYRLLDIAFVVNRATVFAVTSLLVLGALALIDSGLQSLLGSWLVRTGISVQLALALAIGIATRPIHDRVDRVVDDIFFRKRHEAERALRRFARDVVYIDDAQTVLARTVEIVERAANLRCAIFIGQDDGSFEAAGAYEGAPLDRNDEAIVRLRSTREFVELRETRTALLGDYAFPMFARNRLLGVLACAATADGLSAYAPDELEAVGTVAHACGLALDLLRVEALERELAAVRGRDDGMSFARGR